MMKQEYRAKKKKKNRLVLVLSVILAVLVVIAVVLCAFYFSRPFAEQDLGGESGDRLTDYETPKPLQGKSMNILLIGVDEGAQGSSSRQTHLSDVMLVANYDIENKKIHVLQIPRDTYVDNKYHTGGYYKINGIINQSKGGITGLIKAIDGNFKLPVDHYVRIGLDDLRKIVDALGGITVDSPWEFTRNGYHFVKGPQKMNGTMAEIFVRERHLLHGLEELRRQDSQKAFMSGLMDRLLEASMGDVVKLVPVLAQNVKTDFSVQELVSLAGMVKGLKKQDIVFHTPPGSYVQGYKTPNGKKLDFYGMNKQATADMLNKFFRTHTGPVGADELGIVQITDKITVQDSEKDLTQTGAEGKDNASSAG